MESLADAVNVAGRRLYILIDEYDRFANKLMLSDRDTYFDEVGGKKKDGKHAITLSAHSVVASFFEALKVVASNGGNRSFTTGITPIALADGSGANNLYHSINCLPTCVAFVTKILHAALQPCFLMTKNDSVSFRR